MIWVLAASFVLSVVLLLVAASGRADPRLSRLLGAGSRLSARTPTERLDGSALGRIGTMLRARFRTKTEQSLCAAAMPDLLDLLAVSVTAGLSPRLSLERAPDVVIGPLGGVLDAVRRDVSLGAPWHSALERVGKQKGVIELCRLAATIHRAERLGSPIAERLRDLAAEVRNERRARREERARRAPVQMLFPLVFVILPAFVLASVVPALIVATRDIV